MQCELLSSRQHKNQNTSISEHTDKSALMVKLKSALPALPLTMAARAGLLWC